MKISVNIYKFILFIIISIFNIGCDDYFPIPDNSYVFISNIEINDKWQGGFRNGKDNWVEILYNQGNGSSKEYGYIKMLIPKDKNPTSMYFINNIKFEPKINQYSWGPDKIESYVVTYKIDKINYAGIVKLGNKSTGKNGMSFKNWLQQLSKIDNRFILTDKQCKFNKAEDCMSFLRNLELDISAGYLLGEKVMPKDCGNKFANYINNTMEYPLIIYNKSINEYYIFDSTKNEDENIIIEKIKGNVIRFTMENNKFRSADGGSVIGGVFVSKYIFL